MTSLMSYRLTKNRTWPAREDLPLIPTDPLQLLCAVVLVLSVVVVLLSGVVFAHGSGAHDQQKEIARLDTQVQIQQVEINDLRTRLEVVDAAHP